MAPYKEVMRMDLKLSDILIDRMEILQDNVRLGFDGLKDYLKNTFFNVREVYNRIAVPYINETHKSSCECMTAASGFAPLYVRFEMPVDKIYIYSTADLLLDGSITMSEPIVLAGNVQHVLPLRWKELYLRALNVKADVYIWGVY